MKRVLITGLSGTGKSSVIREFAARGYKAIDFDTEEFSHWVDMESGRPSPPPKPAEYPWDDLDWVWREDRVRELLSAEDENILFVSGTAINQGKFQSDFDDIILLTAPADLIVARLNTRQQNKYGSSSAERARVLEHLETVEPLLRSAAHHEISSVIPLNHVVEEILAIVGMNSASDHAS